VERKCYFCSSNFPSDQIHLSFPTSFIDPFAFVSIKTGALAGPSELKLNLLFVSRCSGNVDFLPLSITGSRQVQSMAFDWEDIPELPFTLLSSSVKTLREGLTLFNPL
jgi:hypothetical protein